MELACGYRHKDCSANALEWCACWKRKDDTIRAKYPVFDGRKGSTLDTDAALGTEQTPSRGKKDVGARLRPFSLDGCGLKPRGYRSNIVYADVARNVPGSYAAETPAWVALGSTGA
jgi:hypothetical protein